MTALTARLRRPGTGSRTATTTADRSSRAATLGATDRSLCADSRPLLPPWVRLLPMRWGSNWSRVILSACQVMSMNCPAALSVRPNAVSAVGRSWGSARCTWAWQSFDSMSTALFACLAPSLSSSLRSWLCHGLRVRAQPHTAQHSPERLGHKQIRHWSADPDVARRPCLLDERQERIRQRTSTAGT